MEIYQDKKVMYNYFQDFRENYFYFKTKSFTHKTNLNYRKVLRLMDSKEFYYLSEESLKEIFLKLKECEEYFKNKQENPTYKYIKVEQISKIEKEDLLDRYLLFHQEYFKPSESYISEIILNAHVDCLGKFRRYKIINLDNFNKLNKFLCELGY